MIRLRTRLRRAGECRMTKQERPANHANRNARISARSREARSPWRHGSIRLADLLAVRTPFLDSRDSRALFVARIGRSSIASTEELISVIFVSFVVKDE